MASCIHSAMVISDVQHIALAGDVAFAGVNSCEHFFASSGRRRMSVVVCKSHKECRHTRPRSDVNDTSHSKIPAPIRAPASSD